MLGSPAFVAIKSCVWACGAIGYGANDACLSSMVLGETTIA